MLTYMFKPELVRGDRPKRTPKQHKMLMERIVKIIRLFKPDDGTSFAKWFSKIRNR